MTAERPKCIDGERCKFLAMWNHGHLEVVFGFWCSRYDKRLRRKADMAWPTRCAACRRDFPNEEVPK